MWVTAFSKYCGELVNSGPMEYLNQRHLEFAARQLRAEPSVSITDVADGGSDSASAWATRRMCIANANKRRSAFRNPTEQLGKTTLATPQERR
jgi:hypothetical protein